MFKKSLETKIICIIVAALIIGFGTMAFLDIRRITNNLIYQEKSKLNLLSVSIISSIKRTMLEGNAPQMMLFAEDLKGIKYLKAVQVLRKDGKEAFLDNKTVRKVNNFLGGSRVFPYKKDFIREPVQYTNMEMLKKVLETDEKIQFTEEIGDDVVFTQLTPFIKDDKCNACHGYDKSNVRGILAISIPRKDIIEEIAISRDGLIMSSMAIIIIVLILLSLSIKKMIIKPLKTVVAAIKQLAAGNLNCMVNARSEDEMGELGRQLNIMTENMRKTQLGIIETVNNVTSTSNQINASAEEQQRVTAEHATAISEISATTEELSRSSKQIFEKAEFVSKKSQSALKSSIEGQNAVKANIEKMESIRRNVESISENILNLSEQTQQIHNIINSVNEIAARTDMLAINAAIEASRAGEHGKGFAVVAGEVRKLSDQSQKATGRISSILNEIQNSTNSVVMVVEKGCKDCKAGMEGITETGELINNAMETIKETTGSVQEISLESRQQSIATAQLSEAMGTVNKGMEERTISSKHLFEAAESLMVSSEILEKMLEKYKL